MRLIIKMIKDILVKSKLCFGPMSKELVDTLIKYSNDTKTPVTLIPSRRQIEWDGGYVNNWTTENFSKYVKSQSSYIAIQRDHGGPGQGSFDDDGYTSLENDCKYFDSIHIDPWKKYPKYEDGLKWTLDILNFCYLKNPDLYYEVGTEEAIRKFSAEEIDIFLTDLKEHLIPEIYNRILYCVVQSGTALQNNTNTGVYNNEKLKNMVEVVSKYDKLSKEHNGDFMSKEIMISRFGSKLSSINIAPEIGVLQTKLILEYLNAEDKELFYNLCYKSKKWVKWVSKDFVPEDNKEKLTEISGHYVFSNIEFKNMIMKYPIDYELLNNFFINIYDI